MDTQTVQFKPISPFAMQQPYARAGGQAPGPALTAMLQGSTLHGFNPADIQRRAQSTAKQGQRPTLLDMLLR